jgi:hypothetical protein
MHLHRRHLLALPLALAARPLWAADRQEIERDMVTTWYRLVLELVRHTATYSPPVASRAFAYIGVAAHEALATGNPALVSLAGQLNGLTPPPPRSAGPHDEACVLQAALSASAQVFFANTGPTGQRAMGKLDEQLGKKAMDGIDPEVVARSIAHGQAVAAHILAWSLDDGGAVVDNMGFPQTFTPGENPQDWVPTSMIRQQQAPLLPNWGNNRPFAMPAGTTCAIPAPPAYSDDPASAFYQAAKEVYDVGNSLTDDQKLSARFWSDDPMLSSTPPGHWISIAVELAERDALPADRVTEVMALLGVAMADAFIGCWAAKYEFNLLRPVTYIRRNIDPKWETFLITPPFPEYPSGHSTVSGAAATVLTHAFGDNFAFDDPTHEPEDLPIRSFSSFWEAADDAGLSRLYGGIHYRFAVEEGLTQGRCIGAYTTALKTRT